MRYLTLLICFMTLVNSEAHASVQWNKMSDFGGVGRHRTSGVSVGNKGYMGLGHYNGTGVETYLADWWEFDPSSNSWTQKADYPGNNGNGELGCHAWAYNDVCYVGLGEVEHLVLYKFDPTTNLWSQMTDAPTGNNFQDTQEMIYGNKAFFTDLWHDELFEYDADLDTWTLKGLLPFEWFYSFSGFTLNDLCYVKAYDQLWYYDPNTNFWAYVGQYPGHAHLASIGLTINGKGYIICGYGALSHSDLTSEVWSFDPGSLTWSQHENFEGASRRYAAGFSIGNRGYIGTGTTGTNMADFWEFSPTANYDELSEDSFTIYPNPVEDVLNIESKKLSTYQLVVFDLTGTQIKTVFANNGITQIDFSSFKAGSYLIEFYDKSHLLKSTTIVVY